MTFPTLVGEMAAAAIAGTVVDAEIRVGPIPYTGPMVRAVLDDSKTMTRRIMRVQPPAHIKDFCSYHHPNPGHWLYGWDEEDKSLMDWCAKSPYGGPGDYLWVRENWRTMKQMDAFPPRTMGTGAPLHFEADGAHDPVVFGKLRPGMFMCRWMSRITLRNVSVRIERLQDISEADCIAEGIKRYTGPMRWVRYLDATTGEARYNTAVEAYRALWEQINGAGSWALNPFVWVIEFRRVKP